MADWFPKLSEWFDLTNWSKEQWSIDKTIIKVGYRKISWFVSVSRINYFSQPLALTNNIDLLVADKSQYFLQPCSIIILLIICMKIQHFQSEQLQTKAHFERKTNSYSNRLYLFFPSFFLYSVWCISSVRIFLILCTWSTRNYHMFLHRPPKFHVWQYLDLSIAL